MRKTTLLTDLAFLCGLLLFLCGLTGAAVELEFIRLPPNPFSSPDSSRAQAAIPTVIFPTVGLPTVVPPTPQLTPTLTLGEAIFAPRPSPTHTFLAPLVIEPTPTLAPPTPEPVYIPDRIVISDINLDAPIVPSGYQLVSLAGMEFQQWEAPSEYAAGWQPTSAFLGAGGNTVLDGHHNVHGAVFGNLIDLEPGSVVQVYSGDMLFEYEITNKMILPEREQDLSVRLENARWMLPSTDERLTLITCWPEWSNTHRLIIVARPIGRQPVASSNPLVMP